MDLFYFITTAIGALFLVFMVYAPQPVRYLFDLLLGYVFKRVFDSLRWLKRQVPDTYAGLLFRFILAVTGLAGGLYALSITRTWP